MTQADDEAWKREEQHYEIMQDQRKTKITFAGGHTYEIPQKQDKETSND